MSPSRLLPLWLLAAALTASACSTDTTDPGGTLDGGDRDADAPWMGQDASGGDGDMMMGDGDQPADGGGDTLDGGGDGDLDGGPDACTPLGCAELGYTCGMAKDNCGGDLDCRPTSGDPCTGFDTCGGDATKPNQCGCKPKTCADLGATCGTNVSDGCGGSLTCGDSCASQHGDDAHWVCTQEYACQCSADTQSAACGARTCGSVVDGCGGNYECGPACSTNKVCQPGPAASCQCDTSEQKQAAMCASVECGGTVTTTDGCTYDCPVKPGAQCNLCENDDCSGGTCDCGGTKVCNAGTCCQPTDKATACDGRTCGKVSLGCGVTVECGIEGDPDGCPADQACVNAQHLADGKQRCAPKKLSDLLGKYIARIHTFRQSNQSAIPSRGEALSLVTMKLSGTDKVKLYDEGCAYGSVDQEGNNRSLSPFYQNIPRVVIPALEIDSSWTRPFLSGNGQPGGFTPGTPAFCTSSATPLSEAPVATYGDFDTTPPGTEYDDEISENTDDSGSHKSWLNGLCNCNEGVQGNGLPNQHFGNKSDAKNCRINDVDKDEMPGLTVLAQNGGSTAAIITASVVAYSNTKWSGTINANKYHAGKAVEPDKVLRSFQTCSGPGLACTGLSLGLTRDWSCGEGFNIISFAPLTSEADQALTCADLVSEWSTGNSLDVVKHDKVDPYFNAIPGVTCSSLDQCEPYNAACVAGKCVPKTSNSSCSAAADCGDGWSCVNSTCWPASCPEPK